MVSFVVRQFKGIAPRAEPRLLQENQSQNAVNCKLWYGSLRPLTTNPIVLALTKTGIMQTIYRFGQSLASDTQYWFQWTTDVNVCRGPIYGDTQERTYYTDGVLPQVTDATLATAGTSTAYPNNAYTLGIPAPTQGAILAISGTGAGVIETRIYAYTYVSAWGEEGKPSPASLPIDVLVGQTVNISNMSSAPTGAYNIVSKRIYRLVTGSFGTAYLFVAEIAVATLTYADAILSQNLGEQIPSLTYSMPPATLQGLVSLPNGMMAGFLGKDVYLCEPYKPHAWPLKYVMTVDYDITALGVTDTTLVVLTKGSPYLMQGSSPDGMSMIKVDIPQACVAKRSVRFLANGIVYASPDGMFLIGNGTANLTEAIFTRREWRATFNPASIHGYVYDDKYIGFYDTGTVQGGFILDPQRGDFTLLNWYASAGFYDPQRDALFLVVGTNIVKFDEGSSAMSAIWQSKTFYSPTPVSLGAIRVEAATYPISAQIFADGASIGTFSITSKNAQRLPSGFLANTWSFSVTTAVEVYSVAIAESMTEIASG